LKEFGDFENCPAFRHPQIKGPEKMLSDIGLYNEIKELGLYQTSNKVFPIIIIDRGVDQNGVGEH
jgi:hypothetical protein